MSQDQIGRRIGHIVLTGQLGKGGMGEVYEGWDEVLERTVAVKTLLAECRLSESAKARFRREARILSQLNNPSICRIHDLIETEDADFLILELVEGRTLDRALAEMEERDEKLRIVEDLALALVVAHQENIVHRDLKPQNVMVRPDGRVTVLDFGIARSAVAEVPLEARIGKAPTPVQKLLSVVVGEGETEGTKTIDIRSPGFGPFAARGLGTLHTGEGLVLGTASYMSPEQAAGEAVTSASDIFSLGVILHEMLTGRPAYGDAKGPELFLRVYRGAVEPPGELDPALTQLLSSMLEVEPRTRPSAQGVADRLSSFREKPARLRRRKLRLAAAGLIGLLVLGAAGVAIHARWTASKRAQIAQRFAGEARDLEWLLRAEHLTPPHDVSATYRDVRVRIAAVEEQMAQLGEGARGPGLAAIGRAYLALSDVKSAHEALSDARSIGWRNPEVDFAAGIAMGELYRLALTGLEGIQDPEVVAQERARLRSELRDPALELLHSIRGSGVTFPEYVEGLIALHEERFDDVLTIVDQLQDVRPWFYEAQVLAGRAEIGRAKSFAMLSNDPKAAFAALKKARASLRKALEVGRSDPSIYRLQCEVGVSMVGRRIKLFDTSLTEEAVDESVTACDVVLEILPDDLAAVGWKGLGEIQRGSVLSMMRKLAEVAYQRAISLSNQVLAQSPDNALALSVNGWGYVNLAWEYFAASDPAATKAFEQAISVYERGMNLPDRQANMTLNLSGAYQFRCELLLARAEGAAPGSPLRARSLKDAIASAKAGLELRPDSVFLQLTLAEACLGALRLGSGNARQEESMQQEGRAAVTLALEANPKNVAALVLTARFECVTDGGDVERARKAVQAALELNPMLEREVADLDECLG